MSSFLDKEREDVKYNHGEKNLWFITFFNTLLPFTVIIQLTMQLTQILTVLGGLIGVTLVALSIVAVCSPKWIVLTTLQISETTYDLFQRCDKSLSAEAMISEGCTTISDFQAAEALVIAGIAVLAVGIVVSSPLDTLLESDRWSKSAPQLLLIAGPTLILVGVLSHIKNVLGNFTTGLIELDLGYSFILILTASITGYISAAYFLFVTGFAHGYDRGRASISQESNNDK